MILVVVSVVLVVVLVVLVVVSLVVVVPKGTEGLYLFRPVPELG